jgi:hypothetical protein
VNRMRAGFCVVGVLAVLCVATPAHADSIVFTGVFGTSAGSVYTSPYHGTIDGQAVDMICDSFLQRLPGTPWQAAAHPLSNLGTARFVGLADAQHKYNAAAYLGEMLLGTLTADQRNQVSFALWAPYRPPPASDYNSFILNSGVASYMQSALTATDSLPGAYANWTVYTPTQPAGSLRADQIQEFLVRTPEPPALATLGLNLSGLLGLIVLFRRRLVR